MNRLLLALVVLLGVGALTAQADYLIILKNLGQQEQAPPPGPPMPPPGPMAEPDPDAVPLWIMGTIEIARVPQNQFGPFYAGKPITVTYKGGEAQLAHKLGLGANPNNPQDRSITILVVPAADTLNTNERLNAQHEKLFPKGGKEKPDAEALLNLADVYLKHNRLDKFAETMDQFAADNKTHATAVLYLKVKDALAKPAKDPAAPLRWLPDYKTMTSPHYIAYFKNNTDQPEEVKARLDRLEHVFKTFYFWFALRGTALTIPEERLTTLVTFKEDEFKQLNELLSAPPVLADGFVGTREGVSVLSSKRLDSLYDALEKYTAPFWSQGINRKEILKSFKTGFPAQMARDSYGKATFQATALLMHLQEQEQELTSTSHDGSRQLLYAAGLLRRNVLAPEWLQFGVGSFFEIPLGSPWATTAITNTTYFPLFREQRKGVKPADMLRQVVTDGFFRQAQQEGDYGSLKRARASSWALLYFLGASNKLNGSKANLDGLQKYFKELAKMPRDLELDDEALLRCFCKAFGLLDGNEQIDEKKFEKFATLWYSFLDQDALELQADFDKMNEMIKQATKLTVAEMGSADNERMKPVGPNTGKLPNGVFHPKNPMNPPSGTRPGPRPRLGG